MPPRFIVVLSDQDAFGRVEAGGVLVEFLQIYFGKEQVLAATPAQLQSLGAQYADFLFIGVPTTLAKEQFANLKFRSSALFDYHDTATANWKDSDRDFLASLTDLYLRPFRRNSKSDGFRWGLVPLFRNKKLGYILKAKRWFPLANWWLAKKHDVCFVGSPTRPIIDLGGHEGYYHQRVEWLKQLHADAGDLSIWGGLVPDGKSKEQIESFQSTFRDTPQIVCNQTRIGFYQYWYHLLRSRVALAPAGNARWTYRHYEAAYAGASIVSTDMNDFEMLVPLPPHILTVPDHEPVAPIVKLALNQQRERPELLRENIAHLEQYFDHGVYSKNRPQLVERFFRCMSAETPIADP